MFLTIFVHILLTTSIHESPLHKYNKCPIHLHAVVLQFFLFSFPSNFYRLPQGCVWMAFEILSDSGWLSSQIAFEFYRLCSGLN